LGWSAGLVEKKKNSWETNNDGNGKAKRSSLAESKKGKFP
jgi:hypothetical protein